MSGDLSIYVHVPFCTKKCDYCHFYVVPNHDKLKETYLKALQSEIERSRSLFQDRKIVSLYLGGGTPSLLSKEQLAPILENFSLEGAEITIEANPETITKEQIRDFVSLGINRISIGVQTFNDQELILLGRTHGAGVAQRAVELAYEYGIHNVSIDLMIDLPTQNEASLDRSLNLVEKLPITHLSLYNLTIEPHTPFFKNKKSLTPLLPNEDQSLAFLQKTVSCIESYGLARYEISAFAKHGYESRHNSGYWKGREFLGFGPSAFSYYNHTRYRNVANLQRYARAIAQSESPIDFTETLSPQARDAELLAIALRLTEGVPLPVTRPIQKLYDEGFVSISNNRLFLTEKGKLFYDTVASEIVEV